MELKQIASFAVDHTKLTPGIYLSRTDRGIDTYDLRFKKPNADDYLETPAMHTIEHLAATYLRSSEFSDNIIYFGPMGCRTGFYLLVIDMTAEQVIKAVQDTFRFISTYSGKIPGTDPIECGNYLEHDLEGAVSEAKIYCENIKNLEKQDIYY
ncbi:MAG: S-ribosylhomocysteine lyase [Clostridia bacterium]|nr:S-ribosylhomocysteine lyase [Clostridia bacterium]